jgi:hypothetical protein
MDIKRIAFETREVVPEASPLKPRPAATSVAPVLAPAPVDRAEIASLVDRFLAERREEPAPAAAPAPAAPPPPAAPEAAPAPEPPAPAPAAPAEFVCEDDVRTAIRDGRKIPVDAKTIITPAARELGDAREVFARR